MKSKQPDIPGNIFVIDHNFLGINGAIASYLIPLSNGAVLVESGPGSTIKSLIHGLEICVYRHQPEIRENHWGRYIPLNWSSRKYRCLQPGMHHGKQIYQTTISFCTRWGDCPIAIGISHLEPY